MGDPDDMVVEGSAPFRPDSIGYVQDKGAQPRSQEQEQWSRLMFRERVRKRCWHLIDVNKIDKIKLIASQISTKSLGRYRR